MLFVFGIFSGRLTKASSFIGNSFVQLNGDRAEIAEKWGPPSSRRQEHGVSFTVFSGALHTSEHQRCPIYPPEKEEVQRFSGDVNGFTLDSI